MMNIKLTLDALENLIGAIASADQIERLKLYTAIKTVVSELKTYVHESSDVEVPGNLNIYLSEMITPLRCAARLESNGHDDELNLSWLRRSISKLRSSHCFNSD